MKKLILQIVVLSSVKKIFDYYFLLENETKIVAPGSVVVVPFGKKELIGIVLNITNTSQIEEKKLKPIIQVIEYNHILTKTIFDLIKWTSNYYHYPIGEIINSILPKLLYKNHKLYDFSSLIIEKKLENKTSYRIDYQLNNYQKIAVDTIKNYLFTFKPFLLDGITGSGKTEVYIQIISELIAMNKQALILVPEINLTPQIIEKFSKRFQYPIAVFHSRLTSKERLYYWQMAKTGIAKIVIGTRSSIFTPLKYPGIIIVDEEHDLSYKQQSRLRYSARDLSIIRGKIENIPIILGSATPSIESMYNAKRNRYIYLNLPHRIGVGILPNFHIIDIRGKKLIGHISEDIISKMTLHLEQKEQILLFINRRGFAPILLCHNCGWIANCKYCDVKLTIHHDINRLRCHHCNYLIEIFRNCPKCYKNNLLMIGAGTERIENELKKIFPKIGILRLDSDTTKKKQSLQNILKNFELEKSQILIGTQMVAKGHHFPKISMAVILNIDQSLFGQDFRDEEHLAQIIIQVAGRSGRGLSIGNVYLQTHYPTHPFILNIVDGNYNKFITNCIKERKELDLPPFSHFAIFQAKSKEKEIGFNFLNKIKLQINKNNSDEAIKIFGPISTIIEKKSNYFRVQLLFQSKNRKNLQKFLYNSMIIIKKEKKPKGLNWSLDIDPINTID